jgi:hypothetical protein
VLLTTNRGIGEAITTGPPRTARTTARSARV